MQRSALVALSALMFSVGFLAGHYGRLDSATHGAPSGVTSGKARPSVVSPGNAGSTVPFHTSRSIPPRSSTLRGDPPLNSASHSENHFGDGNAGVPPADAVLTPQEVEDLLSQREDALGTSVAQMEAFIDSLVVGGAPEEAISHFRELQEQQDVYVDGAADLELSMDPSEHTEQELLDDFKMSLEQAGLAPAEVERMVEAYSSPPEPAIPPHGGVDDLIGPSRLPSPEGSLPNDDVR